MHHVAGEVIRFAHPSGRTELRALLRYASFLQLPSRPCLIFGRGLFLSVIVMKSPRDVA